MARWLSRLAPAAALATALAVAGALPGLAGSASVSAVSGPSPYAGCTAGAGTGKNYVNTEVEPQIAINPANPSNIITTWQQDRWSNGGSHGGAAAFTTNGGKSWKETTLPFSDCAPGGGIQAPDGQGFLRASDFWVSFGPDGTAYANALAVDISDGRSGVAAVSSTDGGATWNNNRLVFFSPTNQNSPDKNSITADPVKAGVAYQVWDTLTLATDNPDDNPHTAAYNGDAFFSMTADRGQTWTPPLDIFHTAQHNQTIGNVIVVDPNFPKGQGTIYDFTSFITTPNSISNTQYFVAFVKSTDGGAHWSQPQLIAQEFTVGDVDPNTGAPLRVGDGIPEVAIDSQGNLYATWQDSSLFKRGQTQGRIWDDEIELTSSTNHGTTWSTPHVVSAFSGSPTYTPTVAVNSAGRVALTYYQVDPSFTSTNTTTLPVDYYVAYSDDGGGTFGAPAKIKGPFNQLASPVARGHFLGDYMGLASSGTSFVAAFAADNCDDTSCTASATQPVNAQDIYVATCL